MGPVLREKRSYALVVRGEWPDLQGDKISKDTIKRYRTAPEDRVRIEFSDWELTAPTTSTRDAVALTLSKSVDYPSLQTSLTVKNAKGQILDGAIAIGKDETSWRFTPTQPWQAGPHLVRVSPDLEDVAGNTPAAV
jgi:hypothetical protein